MSHQVMTPDGVESLITAEEAARLCGVSPGTIRTWVHRGSLKVAGHNAHGRKVFKQIDVAKAERATRKRARRG